MATPLGPLLLGLRSDAAVRARFDASPVGFLQEHGWDALQPADLREALYLMADVRPIADATPWASVGDAIDVATTADLDTTATGLRAALAQLDAPDDTTFEVDPAGLDGVGGAPAGDAVIDDDSIEETADDTDGTSDTSDTDDIDGADTADIEPSDPTEHAGPPVPDDHDGASGGPSTPAETDLRPGDDGAVADASDEPFQGIDDTTSDRMSDPFANHDTIDPDEPFSLDLSQRVAELPDVPAEGPSPAVEEYDDGWGDIII